MSIYCVDNSGSWSSVSRSVGLFHEYELLYQRPVVDLVFSEDATQSQHLPCFIVIIVQVASIIVALRILL